MKHIKTIHDMELFGKRVLLRCDLDLTSNRLNTVLPAVRILIDKGAAVILCGHLDVPSAACENESPTLSPIAKRLESLLNCPVLFADNIFSQNTRNLVDGLSAGQILLLENLSFYPEEKSNDSDFANALSAMADVYINDSWAGMGRSWASIVGVPGFLPTAVGPLTASELKTVPRLLENLRGPLVAVLGGAPVNNSRFTLIDSLLDRVDVLILGGGLANPFLKAQGGRIGRSLLAQEDCDPAEALLEKAKARKVKVFLPIDTLAANKIAPTGRPSLEGSMALFDDKIGMDIGPRTAELFGNVIRRAGTTVWSGPMGIWEFPAFSSGTEKIIQALSESDGTVIACGGDTSRAVSAFNADGKFTHISLGSISVLYYMAGMEPPGITALSAPS